MHVDSKDKPQFEASGITPQIKVITPQLLEAEKEARAQEPAPDVVPLLAPLTPYQIGSGDVVTFAVRGQPIFSSVALLAPVDTAGGAAAAANATNAGASFTVDYDGLLHIPVLGSIKVSGLTEMQARKLIKSKLTRYVKDPDVSFQVQGYRSQRVYVDGEVKTPGIQPINDIPMTLVEAISRAGGITPTGDQSNIIVTRNKTPYAVDLPQLVEKGINPASIMLSSGDVVQVKSRDESKVFVLGEVVRPLTLPMRNGRLTLKDALGEAGGINPLSSDGKQVYVVRNATDVSPILYQLDARSPLSFAMAEDFQLKPQDVVYVDVGGLGAWNRVINLIVPSSGTALGIYAATK
ncbi:polysaccharide biosynthesis/export family protein [Glaciimonas sp. PCH181]|uniref:polysaccharide biosynthesis/export family protein n=1 Tax=Glaciimonas sp. PCH181 TaxID=2133943 RepID=UPI000D3A456A|nr:polysaccharide biosynthesis/export family protein [Glaciimonas sp. PCH181]PUA18234.1 hypothetical protein C7W93_13130 [Glaciimonas sp. PCH181]